MTHVVKLLWMNI